MTDSLTQAKQDMVANIKKGLGVSNLSKELPSNPLLHGDFTDKDAVSRVPLLHCIGELLGDICNGAECGRASGGLLPERGVFVVGF